MDAETRVQMYRNEVDLINRELKEVSSGLESTRRRRDEYARELAFKEETIAQLEEHERMLEGSLVEAKDRLAYAESVLRDAEPVMQPDHQTGHEGGLQ